MKKVSQRIVMICFASAVSLSTVACGDLSTLVNNPAVQSSIQQVLDLFLTREVDGQEQQVSAQDIQAVRVNGSPIDYQLQANGQLHIADLPADANQLEVQYADSDQAVMMPIERPEGIKGRIIMRGMTQMKREQGQLQLEAHTAGFDQDQDGNLDTERPQFVHEGQTVSIHDPKQMQVRRFMRAHRGFDFKQAPAEILMRDRFFLPRPMRPCGPPGGPAPEAAQPQPPANGFELMQADNQVQGTPSQARPLPARPCGINGPRPPLPPQNGEQVPPQGAPADNPPPAPSPEPVAQ